MSTQQSIAGVAPRLRIGLSKALLALGVLVAVAVTVVTLALTGANRTNVAIPAGHSAYQASPGGSRCVFIRAEHACVRLP